MTTQQTDKAWKLFQLLGGVLFLVGCLWLFVAFAYESDWPVLSACGLIVGGILVHSYGRLCAWWFDG